MSGTEKKDSPPEGPPPPPPPKQPTQPEGPKDTGGKKRRAEIDGSADGAFRLWSLYSPSCSNAAGD